MGRTGRTGRTRAWSALGALFAALWGSGAGAASPPPEEAPSDPAVAGLLLDMEKMVEVQESLGWTIDRYEIDEMMSPALMSTCSATAATRAAALAALDRRIIALGGPVDEAFRRSGEDLDAVEDLLFATRVRALLDEAIRRAPAECPFWLRPSPDFRGRETDAYRTTLNLETGGIAVLEHAGGRSLLGAGASGRLLLGRGLDTQWTFLAGAEFAGTAQLEQTETKTRFPLSFVAALPLVLRRNDLTWHYEAEIASLAYFTNEDLRPTPGLRVGALVGLSGLRVRSIMPWAGIGIAVEHVIETHRRPATWSLKAGARVGFDLDF